MEKQISFSGVDLTPYSDISPDGQCSALHNVELHNGALRPSLLAGEEFSISGSYSDSRLVHVHATSAFRHLIFLSSNNVIYWADEDAPSSFTRLTTYSGTSVIKSVGNTLIALSDSGIQYYLWSNGGYKYIGSKFPEIGIKFALEGGAAGAFYDDYEEADVNDEFSLPDTITENGIVSIDSSGSTDSNGNKPITDFTFSDKEAKATVTDFIWAGVDYWIEKMSKANVFYAPFFVRYAYCLYDGTYTMASHPILMNPCASAPQFQVQASYVSKKDNTADITLSNVSPSLAFKLCMKADTNDELMDWKDIINSVCIFVTPQVPKWVYGSKVYSASMNVYDSDNAYGIYALYGTSDSFTLGEVPEDKVILHKLQNLSVESYYKRIIFKRKGGEEYEDELISNMQFYKVAEYKIDEINNIAGRSYYEHVKFKYSLYNLVQNDLFNETYDYQSHDMIIPSNAYVYNSRLHIYAITRQLFNGFQLDYMNTFSWSSDSVSVDVFVYIHATDGEDRIVKTSASINTDFFTKSVFPYPVFFYYPDERAYKIVLYRSGYAARVILLSPHPALNGSYYLAWNNLKVPLYFVYPSVSNDPVSEQNKLYVSDADNPFVFPTSGAYTIGTGQILGVATIATPLSTGQAGQFQMMFFCSDGNFAYRVEDDGTYSTPTPMQRDVCTLPSSITILDSEVLFLTEKGAMITNGMSMNCINRQLDGVPDTLPSSLSSSWSIPDTNIAALLQTATVAYDYANSRILFFTGDGSGNALVYSLTDQSWSSATFPAVRTVLNIYPYSYVQMASDGHIVRLADSYTYADSSTVSGLIFTRPLKLDSYALKRIHQFALQGTGAAATVWIYASQDAVTWTLLGKTSSLTRRHIVGRSFKYFRFAVETRLSPSDNISGLRLEYEVSRSMRYR